MFKVGDKVEVLISYHENGYGIEENYTKPGKFITEINLDDDQKYTVYVPTDSGFDEYVGIFREQDLELTEPELKVGNRVLIAHDSKFFGKSEHNPSGVVGAISNIFKVDVELPIEVDWSNGYQNAYKAKDLILINEETKMKIGDRVGTPEGTGTILKISDANATAHVQVSGQTFEFPLANLVVTNEYKDIFFDDVKPEPNGAQGDGQPEGGDVPAPNGGYKPAQPGKDGKPREFKVGEKVEHVDGDMGEGEVIEVTQRTVRVQWPNTDSVGEAPKKEAHNFFKHTQPEKPEGDKKEEAKDEQARQELREERTEEQKSRDAAADLYGILNLQKHLEEKIDTEVEGELKEMREEMKRKQKLEVKVGDKTGVVEGLKHKQLEDLITYAALRQNTLLVGMAGTGKTHSAEQVAEALNLPYYTMSVGAQTTKTDIVGFMSANGQYVRTHFRDAYENGGVFLMDEIDAGNANVLIIVNSALSNGIMSFPDAMVRKHKDFVFVASANTYGTGANRQYVGRNQLDAATLDRFSILDWEIDENVEKNLAVGRHATAWYKAVRAARDYVKDKNIRALITPRATQKGSALLEAGTHIDQVIGSVLLGSVPLDKQKEVRAVATKVFNGTEPDNDKEKMLLGRAGTVTDGGIFIPKARVAGIEF